ncbi:Pkinase domain-containing protein, partial [Cephalotus follicularis]
KSSNENNQNHKRNPSINYIKAAVKKVARVFTVLRGKCRSQSVTTGGNKNKGYIRGTSFLTDTSTGSNNKSSNKFRSTRSYDSVNVTSGQLGAINFSLEEIYRATENFSATKKIGEGGFGTVYKGILGDGSLVAVKRAKKNLHGKPLSEEFKNEILTLSKIEHLNLVKLFGYLQHGTERIIVFEFVSNGNLREHLDGTRGAGLQIGERLDIAIDVAHAITYLHMYTDPPIIHRDIKASNILITEKLRAKVADFGFARLAAECPGASHISTQVKGTAGYLDPEYVRTYQLTEKSDVYSFGVLLVELITGRRPLELKKPLEERVTARWAMKCLKEGDAIITMDLSLRRSLASNMVVENILKLAHQCLDPLRQSRPSMKKCAEVLWGIRKEFRESAFSSSTPSTSHHSANFPSKDSKKSRHKMFGIEDDEDYKFIPA